MIGRHILSEFYDCDTTTLDSPEKIKAALLEATEAAGGTAREVVLHKFQPQGVSGLVALAESHISVHSWPEYRYVAIDVFTCGSKMDSAR